jgi:hypothetical protein
MFSESGQMFTESGQMFTESGQMFTESGQMFTESGQICDQHVSKLQLLVHIWLPTDAHRSAVAQNGQEIEYQVTGQSQSRQRSVNIL